MTVIDTEARADVIRAMQASPYLGRRRTSDISRSEKKSAEFALFCVDTQKNANGYEIHVGHGRAWYYAPREGGTTLVHEERGGGWLAALIRTETKK